MSDASAEELAAAREQCGDNTVCLYDRLATNDMELSGNTLMQDMANTMTNELICKYPFFDVLLG